MDELSEVKRIVLDGLRGRRARVYLFGSRAKGNAAATSDIDVAVLAPEPLPAGLLSLIREQLEESHVPNHVDIVDLSEVEESFQRRILREGMLWSA